MITSRKNDDMIMKILRDMGMLISRSAVMIMLDDDMLTEERPFIEYICAKNIYDALNNPKISPDKILSRGLEESTAVQLIDVYKRNVV